MIPNSLTKWDDPRLFDELTIILADVLRVREDGGSMMCFITKLGICLNGKTYVQYKYLVACTLFLCLSEFLCTKVGPKKYQTTNKKHHLKPPGHSVKDHQPLATKNRQRLASTLPFVGICDLGLTCLLYWLSFHPTLVGCWFVRLIFLGWQCYILI